jgi:hypothetical protein
MCNLSAPNPVYPGMTASSDRRFTLFLTLLLAAVIHPASAQDAATTQPITVANKHYDAQKELPRLTRTYKLSPQQSATIKPILIEQQRKIHELGEDNSLSNSDWSSGVRKVHQLAVQQIRAELTDLQATSYARDEEKFAKKSGNDSNDDGDDGRPFGPPGGGGPGGPGGGGPPGI